MNGPIAKLLVLSDTQLGAGQNLAHDRLGDNERTLYEIADLADEHDVDAVIHCGDVFERRHPSEEERLVFKRWANRIVMQHRLIVIAGNHDISTAASAAALDLYDECEFVREPTVLDLGSCSLACLPWCSTAGLRARFPDVEGGEINAAAAECLLEIARELHQTASVDVLSYPGPKILATHFWIEGATSATGAGEGVIHEPVLPIAELEAIGFDAVIAGHVHNGAVLRELEGGGFIGYCGTPYVTSWGEVNQRHGVWLIDTDRLPMRRFIDLPDRSFVTVSVDLTEEVMPIYPIPGTGEMSRAAEQPVTPEESRGCIASGAASLDETAAIAAAIEAQGDLTGAVVRFDVTATEEQARRIDRAGLLAMLDRAGVHRVSGGVQPKIVRPARARVAGFDAGMGAHEALDAWCDAQTSRESEEESAGQSGLARASGSLTGGAKADVTPSSPASDSLSASTRTALHALLTESIAKAAASAQTAGGVFVPVEMWWENVGRYRKGHHKFEPGATVLVGANGAGKSVILRCVELALFANGGRDLRAELAPFGDELRIELVFTLGGVLHRVRRSHKRGGRSTVDLETLAVAA